MTPDQPGSKEKKEPVLKQRLLKGIATAAERAIDPISVDTIIFAVSLAATAMAYSIVHDQREREACQMMEAGKPLQSGTYLGSPRFNASGFLPEKEIPYCEKRFGISVTPENAQKSYEQSFSEKDRGKAKKNWF